MSFYVTLPSNSSQNEFPNNTLTHFITRLKNPLRLSGNYEVGLAQILFPKNWRYRQDASILVESPTETTRINVEFFVNESLETLLQNIIERLSQFGYIIEMKFDKITSKIIFAVPPDLKLIFEKGLNSVFGFSASTFQGSEDIIFTSDETVVPYFNDIFINSHICEYQLVGDTEAPLLQVVSTTNVTENYIEKIFDIPHYIPIARNNLENIEIDIRSDQGNPIQFQAGKVVVKLHFRKKNYY